MHDLGFIQDLAALLLVAGITTVLFHRLRQPVVLGYLLAGLIIGPHTPPFPLIEDEATVRTLAELGVVFLLFHLGLEFSLRKLRAVGTAALIAALTEIMLMLWVGYEIGRLFGWSVMDAIFLGAMLSISSTTIIVKVLEELNCKRERFAQLIFGILIVEDILAIAIIALLSGLGQSGEFEAASALAALGKLAVFLVGSVVVGLLSVPRLVDYVARFERDEMLLVAVLGLCFGFCLLVARLEYSIALGAFLMGALMAEAKSLPRIVRLIEPVRDLFSAIFFVAVGTLIQPQVLIEYAGPIAIITLAVVLGKVLTCSLGTFLAGHDGHTALRVGMGLAQIGEFSFIIAALGLALGVIGDFLYSIAVAVAAITTFLTPYLMKASDNLANALARALPANLRNYLGLYTRWAARLRGAAAPGGVTRMVHRSLWIVAINSLLIVGIFLSGAYAATLPWPAWFGLPALPPAVLNTLLWSLAVLLSLPLFLVSYRKLQAMSLLLAEVALTTPGEDITLTPAVRTLVAQVVPLAAVAGFAVFALALSASILPPQNVFFALIALFAIVTWWLHRAFARLYGRLQIALERRLGTLDRSAG